VGVFVPEDPNAADELAKQGEFAFDFGTFFFKGQSMGTGQANVKHYNAALRDLITEGKATPGFLVSHELPLAEAPAGYSHFDKREDGWTKVLLHPAD
jgi:glutathione-independent formaldehyde dehydrogenase